MKNKDNLMALDLGLKRVGVATCSFQTNLPRPLVTLNNDNQLITNLKDIIKEHQISKIIIGLPRNLNGEDTPQTRLVRQMASDIEQKLGIEIEFQDEALSSVRAEEDIKTHKSDQADKGIVDKLAACYILEDYLRK